MYSPEHCVDFFGRNSPQRARISSFTRFLDHTQRHITISRTPLDERSPRRRDLYLTIHNTHKREWEPCPRRDSNPQSQQARASRNTPQTAKPLESAHFGNTHWKHKGDFDLTRSSKFSLTSGLVGGGGGVGKRHGPAALPLRNDTLPTVREAVWYIGPVRKCAKNSALPGFDPQTLQLVAIRYPNWAIPVEIN